MTLPDYNQQFLAKIENDEPLYNNAERYGVSIKKLPEISVSIGAETYWRVIGVHHLSGAENMGNHHIYVDVVDENGLRINGARLVLTQGTTSPVFAVVDKPTNEAGTNFPMWSSTRATVAIEDSLPSESVSGLRTDHADEEVGNTWGHHSFYIVFQRTPIPASDEEIEKIERNQEPLQATPNNTSKTGKARSLTLEDTIALTGEPLIVPLNPNTSFYKISKQQNLGERLTSEYDVQYQGRNYRAQIFERGIVYAEVGDWGNIKVISRTN